MIRKLIRRTFIASAVLLGICVLCVLVTGLLVTSKPDFYVRLSDQNSDDRAIVAELEQKARQFEQWAMASAVFSQRMTVRQTEEHTDLESSRDVSKTFHMEITEAELNGLCISSSPHMGDVRNPRVEILDEHLRVGTEVKVGDSSLIFSAVLKPLITPEGKLQMEIKNARLGSMPFPLHTLLSLLTQRATLSNERCRIDLAGQMPVVTIDVSEQGRRTPAVTAMRCSDGCITIEFQSPDVEALPGDSSNARISNRTTNSQQ